MQKIFTPPLNNATSDAPIGVFDSGVGGISILQALVENFPEENFLYLGDTARLPYGTKSAETVRKYAGQSLKFLAKSQVKAFVIACNTASSAFLETTFEGRPVYNMIDCGVKELSDKSTGKKALLLATKTTVKSKAYESRLRMQSPEIELLSVPAPLFIPLVEEGLSDGPVVSETIKYTLKEIQPLLLAQAFDTCLLGCTHFPFLKKEISHSLGADLQVIDSSSQLIKMLQEDTQTGRLQLRSKDSKPSERKLTFALTDSSEHFVRFIQKLWPQAEIHWVEL